MKKTWQWVIEYRREIDSDYTRKLVEELSALSADCRPDSAQQAYYRSYIEWVILPKSLMEDYHSFPEYNPGKEMEPRHLNDCLERIVRLLKGKDEQDVNFRSQIIKNAHFRLRNVKTGEVIPGELFV